MDPDPDLKWGPDPDPGSPKLRIQCGSGSETLPLQTWIWINTNSIRKQIPDPFNQQIQIRIITGIELLCLKKTYSEEKKY